MSKRAAPIKSPFKGNVPTLKKPKVENFTDNADKPKAICVIVKPTKPDHYDKDIPLPTPDTLPRAQKLVDLDENAPDVSDMKAIIYVPLTYAEKGVGKIMYKNTDTSTLKKNFLEQASVLGKSVIVKSDVPTESGYYGTWNKKQTQWYDSAGLITVVTDKVAIEDLTKQAREHCNDNLSPRIVDICKANEIRIYKNQEPKLRDNQDIRVVKSWSEALTLDDIEYIWYQYYGTTLNKVIVANPWTVYSIWAPGKVPVEEKYNLLNPKFLHKDDLKAYDEITAAMTDVLDSEAKSKNVLGESRQTN